MNTLVSMGKPVGSGLSDEEADHLARLAKRRMVEIWPDLEAEDGSIRTTAAAKRTGVSQSLLSQILMGSRTNRRAGIRSLVRLRYALGCPLDVMLGLKPLPSAAVESSEWRRAFEEALRAVQQEPISRPSPSKRRSTRPPRRHGKET